jgi:K+-sensing histidine kinase KdpD
MRARQKGLRFEYLAETPLPTYVEIDETRLRQVLLNLLGNALKFTERGQVTLRVRVANLRVANSRGQDSTVRFEISDSGVGIPAEQLERIFQPFERVEAAPCRPRARAGPADCAPVGASDGREVRPKPARPGHDLLVRLPLRPAASPEAAAGPQPADFRPPAGYAAAPQGAGGGR